MNTAFLSLPGLLLVVGIVPGIAAEPPQVVHDWPEYCGPNGQYADTSGVKLADDMNKISLLWESEEKGIGFGKAHSGYGRDIKYGGDLPPSGISSPIVAGGLVIMSYFLPSGDMVGQDAKGDLKPEVWEKYSFKWNIAADDVVIAIDARTGKTRWKQVFAGQGRNLGSGKRNIYGCTPIAQQGRVYAQGSCGAIYCLDLQSGKPVWQTPNEADYEADKKKALASAAFGKPSGPTGWLMIADGTLIAPFKTGISPSRGGIARGISLENGKTLWEAPMNPNLLAYGTVAGKACLLNTAICIEAKTGTVIWKQKPPITYLGPPVTSGSMLISYVPNPKSTDPKQPYGSLAGFAVDDKGAKQVWVLPERFQKEMGYDAGGFRNIAARDGLIYHVVTSTDTPGQKGTGTGVVQIIRATDGSILASQPCDALSLPFLWGDRLVVAGDINHRPRAANPEYWQLYSTDPADFRMLGKPWLATDKHQATGGYELQTYDCFADGLVFFRVFGGIRCYDLRPR